MTFLKNQDNKLQVNYYENDITRLNVLEKGLN